MPSKLSDKVIPRFKKGQRTLPERQMNAIVDGVNRLLVGVNAPRQPRPTGKSGGSPVIVLELVTHNDDYLVCQDADLNTYNVAKPFELRRSSFDTLTVEGVTYTYTSASEREATDGVDTETQFITPAYRVGAEIYALKVRPNTGVQTTDSPPEDILYLEMNQGRAWAWDGL